MRREIVEALMEDAERRARIFKERRAAEAAAAERERQRQLGGCDAEAA